MAKAKKLPSGNWRVQVFAGMENGKKKYKSFTAPTRKEAEFQAAQYALERKERENGNITVREAIDRYIKSKEPVLSPSTIRGYRIIYRNNLKSIMDTRLEALTTEKIQQAISEDAKTHQPKTVRNIHGLLSSALAMFAPDIRLTTTLPQKKRPTYYTPTDKDIETLLKTVEGTELELPVLLASTGSLRRSEICALTQGDVSDLGVVVNKALVRGVGETWHIKTPKTDAGNRFVPLPPQVIQKLRTKGEGRICSLTPELLSKHFRLALDRASLPHFRLHDLRHYFASTLHAIGVPDKYIMLYGGWESESTLHGVYQHALRDRMAATDAQVVDYFSRVIGDENITRNTTQKK